METTFGVSYFYGHINKKSESLRSLIKERAFINSSASSRKSNIMFFIYLLCNVIQENID